MPIQHLKFNKSFFQDFWGLLKPYWVSEDKLMAWSLLSLGILCDVGQIYSSVGFNNFHRDFFNALQAHQQAAIFASLLHYLGFMTLYVICIGSNIYFIGLLSLRWRRWLTENYLKKWLNNYAYYQKKMLNDQFDNPDQRISEDLEKFPEFTLSLFQQFFHSMLMMVSFSIILWNLSKGFTVAGIEIPGFFYFVALIYAIIGTYLMNRLGQMLPYLDYRNQQYNADFRFKLMKIRESSNLTATISSQEKECHSLFGHIFDNVSGIVKLKARLMYFSKGFSFFAYAIGLLVSMPLFLSQKMQIGEVMQTSSAFNSVVSAFAFFIEAFNSLADWRSVVYRLTEFNRIVERADAVQLPANTAEAYFEKQ